MNDTIDVITALTFVFFKYLLLAITVERTTEILMAIFKYFEFRRKWYTWWTDRAKALRTRLDRLFVFKGVHRTKPDNQLSWLLWRVMVPTPAGWSDVIAVDLIRSNALRLATRLFAFFLSVLFVYSLWLDPKVFLKDILESGTEGGFFSPDWGWQHFRMLLLAGAISVGSEPLHQIIGAIEEYAKKTTVKKKGGAS